MFDERLPTKLWIDAGLALCSGRGIPAVRRFKGDPDTGLALIKIDRLDGSCRLLGQQRDLDGHLVWVDAIPNEATPNVLDAEAYIERARSRDPDLWVIEVEDKSGTNPFDAEEA